MLRTLTTIRLPLQNLVELFRSVIATDPVRWGEGDAASVSEALGHLVDGAQPITRASLLSAVENARKAEWVTVREREEPSLETSSGATGLSVALRSDGCMLQFIWNGTDGFFRIGASDYSALISMAHCAVTEIEEIWTFDGLTGTTAEAVVNHLGMACAGAMLGG